MIIFNAGNVARDEKNSKQVCSEFLSIVLRSGVHSLHLNLYCFITKKLITKLKTFEALFIVRFFDCEICNRFN